MQSTEGTGDFSEHFESRLSGKRRKVVVAVDLEIARLRHMRRKLSEVDAEVLLAAIDCFGSAEGAAHWLTNPDVFLKEASPLAVATTEDGKEQVLQLLWKIDLGMFSSSA